ncbi:oxidoreductase NAD-binding domain-containing protein [Byssothecium circinans]|uniref:NADH-cytochrome b5 reductase n=1 Tax=Byssothecium circinans TaxID=147558 RepID=A0A6A5TDY3_9PLEO|nr:oxidoreductase NAD-binding domain-containing protein [Byssothecium circinans]
MQRRWKDGRGVVVDDVAIVAVYEGESMVEIGLTYTYLNRNIHADTSEPRKAFGKGPAFVSLPLESSETVNHNTKRLRFKLPHEDDISGLSTTSALLTMSWPKGCWTPVARPYTPISDMEEPGYLELMVKQYPNGKQSTHLHSLQPGDKLLFVAALRGHQWKPNAVPHVTLIAGGAGITPIYQLARGILSDPADKTAVTIVYGTNTDNDVLLKKEFDEFKKEFGDRFEYVYTVSQPSQGSPWRKGHVTKELLEKVASRKEKIQGAAGGEKMVFVCGPPAMEKSLVGSKWERGILQELGYEKKQIITF